MDILDLARRNQQKAWKIIEDTKIIPAWEKCGCQSESRRFFEYGVIDETLGY